MVFYSWKTMITPWFRLTTPKKVLLLLLLIINGSLYSHIYRKNVFLSVNKQYNASLKDKVC